MQFGTPLAKHKSFLTTSAMKTTNDRYSRLKRQARRLMLAGQVERYMRILREMHELHGLTGRLATS